MAIFTLLHIHGSSLGDRSVLLPKAKINQQNKTRKQSTDLKDAPIYTADHSFVLFSHQMSRDCGAAWDSSHMFKCTIKANERKRGGEERRRGRNRAAGERKKTGRGGTKRKGLTWKVSSRHTLSPGWSGGICPQWTGWCIASSVLNQGDTEAEKKARKKIRGKKERA